MSSGKVYLVGAGPGAAELLTVRATRVLARAEIVFHDALINKEILDYCPPECVFVPVGTRGGHRVPQRQENIHRMLADAAQHYTTIVRLKGGDPCIFGRGGEEIEFLSTQGIPWEVVPGISAGVGGLSLLGLPLTHRDLASSAMLLTGSQMASGAFGGLPLAMPLLSSHTLVFYMPFRHIVDIVNQLLHHGMPPQTPAMCVSWLSYPQQTVVTAPLTHISAAASALEAPVIMVVGDVVGWWEQLQQRNTEAEQA
jgi:uroporphyrinogen III methyltransferase/synthase